MIYYTFKSVEDSYNYAVQKMKEVYKDAESYIKAVIREAGALEVNVCNKPTIITLKGKPFEDGEQIVLYQNVAKPMTLTEFSVEEVLEICKEIRSMKLVEEYGDEKESTKEEGHESA